MIRLSCALQKSVFNGLIIVIEVLPHFYGLAFMIMTIMCNRGGNVLSNAMSALMSPGIGWVMFGDGWRSVNSKKA